ncbi:stevor [Plasmodium reichenowi]|uniref:Stevor n=1 Tax=Plasmodium reichenowi TaxID=5854 RepID=A0A060RLZ2_PLARE|nr:stevor [Plasmodium reichenowi]
MKVYYLKMLLFTFLINKLLLAQTQKHNPHYYNDPELKEIIDKMNEEAIKKYQQTHDPYKQLQEVVEKNGTKYTGGNDAEPMSTLEKELFETYEKVFGEENHIMLKSSMYPNDDDKSDNSQTCECTNINNMKLGKTKGRDKYLKHLKGRCSRGIYISSLATVILTSIALYSARAAAIATIKSYSSVCTSYVTIFNMLNEASIISALKGVGACTTIAGYDIATPATTAALGAIYPCGIAALVLLILTVVLIILYIWLYRRRKRSWKHECKKHLCK